MGQKKNVHLALLHIQIIVTLLMVTNLDSFWTTIELSGKKKRLSGFGYIENNFCMSVFFGYMIFYVEYYQNLSFKMDFVLFWYQERIWKVMICRGRFGWKLQQSESQLLPTQRHRLWQYIVFYCKLLFHCLLYSPIWMTPVDTLTNTFIWAIFFVCCAQTIHKTPLLFYRLNNVHYSCFYLISLSIWIYIYIYIKKHFVNGSI